MSLRTRLLVTVLALLALGLAAAAIATYDAVRADFIERADVQLRVAGRAVAAQLDVHQLDAPLIELPSSPGSRALWKTLADSGSALSFVQVRAPDGHVLQTTTLGTPPPAADALRPAAVTAANPDGERFASTDVAHPALREQNWRFRSAWLPDQRGYLIVGMRMASAVAFGSELARMQSVVTVVALAVVAVIGWGAVRHGMRPLEQMAATASAIGAGDLTRRVARADTRTEVGRLGRALNAMLSQIESAFRDREASQERLRQFVADASHELRTPVASIRGYAELFRHGAASRPRDLAVALRRIESEAERMGQLVDELLLLARLDQGRALERAQVDLTGLAGDAITDASAIEPRRRLALDADGPVVVGGDAARLRQMLDNLLANVRQHTPHGTPATVRVAVVDGEAVLEVSDRGPGLTEQQSARVFERFYRADPSRSHDHPGAGLGLSIVRAVAMAHGGQARVRSAPGVGTTIEVRLPLSADK